MRNAGYFSLIFNYLIFTVRGRLRMVETLLGAHQSPVFHNIRLNTLKNTWPLKNRWGTISEADSLKSTCAHNESSVILHGRNSHLPLCLVWWSTGFPECTMHSIGPRDASDNTCRSACPGVRSLSMKEMCSWNLEGTKITKCRNSDRKSKIYLHSPMHKTWDAGLNPEWEQCLFRLVNGTTFDYNTGSILEMGNSTE